MDYEIIKINQKCASRVKSGFFNLKVSRLEGTVLRERVYCYELYHQLRLELKGRENEYTLMGELDKKSHPEISNGGIPDFLLHLPGGHQKNKVIIEVKNKNANSQGIRDDLERILQFITEYDYEMGILIVYGPMPTRFSNEFDDIIKNKSSILLLNQEIPETLPAVIRPKCYAKERVLME